MTSISSSLNGFGFSEPGYRAAENRSAATRTSWGSAVILDLSPLAFSTPSPYDSANGQIVQLGARPELIAELESARQSQQAAFDAEQKTKEDEKANKIVKPLTLKDLLEKLDEKYDILSAERQERRNPNALTAEQRALLREERLGPLWKKRFGLRG
ncbi:MAG: hypothetical protein ACOVKO_01395 [Elstera sp.]